MHCIALMESGLQRTGAAFKRACMPEILVIMTLQNILPSIAGNSTAGIGYRRPFFSLTRDASAGWGK